jgi:hypothetical protein
MNDLNDLLESLHSDKVALLRAQLAAIETQEQDRLTIDTQIKRQLEENIGEVRLDELRVSPDPESSEAADAQREARVQFLFKRLDLVNRLSDEMRHCWNDYQRLEEQKREIQRELTELQQRRDRTNAA